MSMAVGRAKLARGYQELLAEWQDTRTGWDDAASRDFEQTHLVPLEARVRDAVEAMDEVGRLIERIRRECI